MPTTLQRPGVRCAVALAASTLALGATACGADASSADGKVTILAAFYPLQFVAERVGGDAVKVTNLVKPGTEPHDVELNPEQVASIGRAGLVVYLAGFQPAVDEAVEQQAKDRSFDVAGVAPLRDAPPGEESGKKDAKDPHIWLDPTRLAAIADRLAERLGKVDAGHAADYRSRAAALRTDLDKLDQEYGKGLATCQRRQIVTSHAAFGYLAERYKLEQIAISGVEPDADIPPQRLAEVTRLAKEKGATTIFFETLVSPKVAETIAKEVGAKTDVLDPIEGLDEGSADDYLSVMRTNLGKLKPALGCT